MKKVKINKKRLIKSVLVSALIFLIFVTSFELGREYNGTSKQGESPLIVSISPGASTYDIAKILSDNGVIRYPLFFRLTSKLAGHDGKYREGLFKLNRSMGYNYIFSKLSGTPDESGLIKITIPEGYEFRQISELLNNAGLINSNKFADIAQNYDFGYDFLNGIPKRENRLEGYLFPDTYYFDATATEETILNMMLARFDEIYTDTYKARAKELSMTTDQVVTLASIIEREAQGDNDRDKVASVFHNRIKSTTYPYLESCATVQYILKERKAVLSVEDTKIKSPYNTYINPGLPIGPIASPGEKSIRAALYPAKTDYLFFVLDSSGVHRFAKTFDEHQKNALK